MSRHSVSWLKQSLTRKISSLSTILLSFIFVVIIYSIVTLIEISQEMREVAEIDIPLAEVVTEVEILQLQQHILIEQIRLVGKNKTKDAGQRHDALIQQFNSHEVAIAKQLVRARQLISNALNTGQVIERVSEHRQVINSLEQLSADRAAFTSAVVGILDASEKNDQTAEWKDLEAKYNDLNNDIESLLRKIESMTEDIARHTEKHAYQFMVVNIGLGISAFIIGVYITLYIILSFRRRVTDIQNQLTSINNSLEKNEAIPSLDTKVSGEDELSELASNVYSVIDRFTDELNSRYQVEDKLIELAVTDKLTGALNRHRWEESLNAEIELSKRGSTFSLIAIDLDHFKSINDTYGHGVGDQVLVETARIIKDQVRVTDLLFRLGGEEFVVLGRQIDQQAASVIAEKLRAALENNNSPELPNFTASFGVVEYTPDESAKSLLNRADQALYQSKNNGRNRITVS